MLISSTNPALRVLRAEATDGKIFSVTKAEVQLHQNG